MPHVNVKITKEGATPKQKAELIRRITKALVDVLGKNPQTTFVVIEEIETAISFMPETLALASASEL